MSFCSGRPGEEYYTCNTYKKKGKERCSSHYIKYSEVYKAVLADIKDTVHVVPEDAEGFIEAVMKQVDGERMQQRESREKEMRDLKKRIADLDARFDQMYEDRLSGLLSDTKFKELASRSEAEQTAARERLAELEAMVETSADQERDLKQFVELASRYTEIETLDRELLNTLVDSIVIGDRIHTGDGARQTITVNYRFMRRQKREVAA